MTYPHPMCTVQPRLSPDFAQKGIWPICDQSKPSSAKISPSGGPCPSMHRAVASCARAASPLPPLTSSRRPGAARVYSAAARPPTRSLGPHLRSHRADAANLAIARPMPLDPPVTRTTQPCSEGALRLQQTDRKIAIGQAHSALRAKATASRIGTVIRGMTNLRNGSIEHTKFRVAALY